jgi:hypothetical protein
MEWVPLPTAATMPRPMISCRPCGMANGRTRAVLCSRSSAAPKGIASEPRFRHSGPGRQPSSACPPLLAIHRRRSPPCVRSLRGGRLQRNRHRSMRQRRPAARRAPSGCAWERPRRSRKRFLPSFRHVTLAVPQQRQCRVRQAQLQSPHRLCRHAALRSRASGVASCRLWDRHRRLLALSWRTEAGLMSWSMGLQRRAFPTIHSRPFHPRRPRWAYRRRLRRLHHRRPVDWAPQIRRVVPSAQCRRLVPRFLGRTTVISAARSHLLQRMSKTMMATWCGA